VVKLVVEPHLDLLFHPDSYGSQPGKSAKKVVDTIRKCCWKYNWIVEFDIKGAFDHIEHELLMKEVRHHVKEKWILLHVEICLVAPFVTEERVLISRDIGTPQNYWKLFD
jgi:RNA-directed DNA polymerase